MLSVYIFYHWSAWLLLGLICVVTSSVTFRLLLDTPRTSSVASGLVKEADKASAEPHEEVAEIAKEDNGIYQVPLFDFPATPMPSTPLIRILDTIDLSSSDVEHFLRVTADYKPITSEAGEQAAQDIKVNE